MTRKLIYISCFCWYCMQVVQGQQNERDSIRLPDPEWQREMIDPSLLLNPEKLDMYLFSSPSGFPIIKDFTPYLQADTTRKFIEFNKLPTGVMTLYGLELIPDTVLGSFILHDRDVKMLKAVYPGGIKFSAEDALRWLFWKSERAKRRNKKRANAWKSYNMP